MQLVGSTRTTAYVIACATLLQGAASGQLIEREDIARVHSSLRDSLQDLSFTAETTTSTFHRLVHVNLIGRPRWQFWKLELFDRRSDGNASGLITRFRGRYYEVLQTDGMGLRLMEPDPEAYASYAGMTLEHLGLSAEKEDAGLNWLRVLAKPTTVLEDSPERPGVAWLHKGGWRFELDAQYGFMPIRSTMGDSVCFEFLDYRQYGPLWMPSLIRRTGDQQFEIRLSDISVNQGLSPENLDIRYPFGVSILKDQDVTEIYGAANLTEAEEGLQNWLSYFGRFDRTGYDIAPGKGNAVLTRRATWEPYIVAAALVIGVLLLTRTLLGGRRKAGAVSAASLIAICAAQARASGQVSGLLNTEGSAASCAYLIGDLYGNGAPLPDLLAELRANSGTQISDKLIGALENRGVHTFWSRPNLDELAQWPYPIILELRPRQAMPYVRYAVLAGENEHGYTLIDPNPFGTLSPVTRKRLLDLWSGAALFTSPTDIHVRTPWTYAVFASILFAAIGVIVLTRATRKSRALFTVLCVGFTIGAIGCSDSKQEAPRQSTKPSRGLLTQLDWDVGEIYPGTVQSTFQLSNAGGQNIVVDKVEPSCGCMAANLPVGVLIPAGASRDFTLSLDFSGQRGVVSHTLLFQYSDGASDKLRVSARVKQGLFPSPSHLLFQSSEPGEDVLQELQVVCDDGAPFDILSAEAPRAQTISFDNDSKTVFVTVYNGNDQALFDDTLTIITDHPRARVLHVPIVGQFELTWEARPSGFFFRDSDGGEFVERTVTVLSHRRVPFLVKASRDNDTMIAPKQDAPGFTQPVDVRLRRPETRDGAVRIIVSIETTLPDAPIVDVPFVFYR